MDVMPHHLCYIVFLTSKSLGQTYSPGEALTQGVDYQEAGSLAVT